MFIAAPCTFRPILTLIRSYAGGKRNFEHTKKGKQYIEKLKTKLKTSIGYKSSSSGSSSGNGGEDTSFSSKGNKKPYSPMKPKSYGPDEGKYVKGYGWTRGKPSKYQGFKSKKPSGSSGEYDRKSSFKSKDFGGGKSDRFSKDFSGKHTDGGVYQRPSFGKNTFGKPAFNNGGNKKSFTRDSRRRDDFKSDEPRFEQERPRRSSSEFEDERPRRRTDKFEGERPFRRRTDESEHYKERESIPKAKFEKRSGQELLKSFETPSIRDSIFKKREMILPVKASELREDKDNGKERSSYKQVFSEESLQKFRQEKGRGEDHEYNRRESGKDSVQKDRTTFNPRSRTFERARKFDDRKKSPSMDKNLKEAGEFFKELPSKFRLNSSSNLQTMLGTNRGRWEDFSISELTRQALTSLGIIRPNAVQNSVIPELLKPSACVLCAAETGSGKTLTYMVPIVEKLKLEEAKDASIREESSPRAVILVPSGELVDQVSAVAKTMSHFTKLRIEKLSNVLSYEQRSDRCTGLIDMVIGTPGQILSAQTKTLMKLDKVSHLVIDEGDTLLSEDFGEEIKKILSSTQKNLDTVVIASATIPLSLTQLMEKIFPNALRLGSSQLHRASDRVDVRFLDVMQPGAAKLQACEALLTTHYNKNTLIFCNDTTTATRIHRLLSENQPLLDKLSSVPSLLHGAIPEKQRQAIFKRFQDGYIHYLVCTDLASRGLDTTQVSHVIMYDFARNTIDFIHRAGRTGRLIGSRGLVSCLVSSRDEKLSKAIKKSLKSGESFTDDNQK